MTTGNLTSPVLQAKKVAKVVADKWRDLLQVMGPNPGSQERLVSVPECGVHQQEAFVGTDSLGKSFRTITQQHVTETYRRVT